MSFCIFHYLITNRVHRRKTTHWFLKNYCYFLTTYRMYLFTHRIKLGNVSSVTASTGIKYFARLYISRRRNYLKY